MDIITGIIQKAQKVVIYGPEGIGKSTLASQFPNPVFIDTEGSTNGMNVARTPKPTSWELLCGYIRELTASKQFKTIVVDTIDWAEQLCINSVCALYQKKGIEDFGYGNGYVYEKEEFGKFLNLLQETVDSGINVVLTAHAQIRKFEQPDEMGAYDRWELKLGKKTGSQISPLVKEWADMVLFANYKTFAVATDDKGKKFKAQGGKRVIYTTHSPCWDAKNRAGLPDEIPMDYQQIRHIIEPQGVKAQPVTNTAEPEPQPPQLDIDQIIDDGKTAEVKNNFDGIPTALADLMKANNVTDEEIRKVVAAKGYFTEDTPIKNYPEDFISGVLIGAWQQVFNQIEIMRNGDMPF
ncbi:MAG: ATP-binding protein [Acutalibacteraceae bacterium]